MVAFCSHSYLQQKEKPLSEISISNSGPTIHIQKPPELPNRFRTLTPNVKGTEGCNDAKQRLTIICPGV